MQSGGRRLSCMTESCCKSVHNILEQWREVATFMRWCLLSGLIWSGTLEICAIGQLYWNSVLSSLHSFILKACEMHYCTDFTLLIFFYYESITSFSFVHPKSTWNVVLCLSSLILKALLMHKGEAVRMCHNNRTFNNLAYIPLPRDFWVTRIKSDLYLIWGRCFNQNLTAWSSMIVRQKVIELAAVSLAVWRSG